MKRNHRVIPYILSTTLAITSMPILPVSAAEQADIVIRTVEDFQAFSEACRNQNYSQGKTVSLEADLDFSGIEYVPVPAFFGTFNGNHHNISGLYMNGAVAGAGLFRYVEEGAIVADLDISGSLNPDASRNEVGGVAAVNRGTIRNCTFSGDAQAKKTLGGIVGRNEETGLIEGCTNYGVLLGNREIGGIAGKNDGTITGSENQGEINTSPNGIEEDFLEDNQLSFSMNLSMDSTQLRQELQTEKVNDVGGIAGLSTGTVKQCSNRGKVGYKSVGYNVGGIVGRHSGVLMLCDNEAEIIGRKDVGGIAGQLEPFLSIEYGQSTVDQVSDLMDQVLKTKDNLSDNIQSTSDDTTDYIDRMDDIMKQIRDLTRDQKADQRQKRLEYEDKAGKELDKIDEVLANMELELGSREADRAESRLRGNVGAIRQILQQVTGFIPSTDPADWAADIQDILASITQLQGQASDLVTNADDLVVNRVDGIEDGIRDFEDQLDSLRVASKDLLDETRDYKDQLLKALDGTDDDVTAQLDRLYSEMDGLSDSVKDGRDKMRKDRDELDRQIDDIQSTIKDGRDELKAERDDLLDEGTPFFQDISDETEAMKEGVVVGCNNKSLITADYQCGGIVGNIGIEIGTDPEEDIKTFGDRSLYITRSAAAYVQECRNDGNVETQKDYAGGIVGVAWLGSLKSNQNYGDVTSVDGNYTGGIVGDSQAIVNKNYTMCEVSGHDYIGGIVGRGKTVKDNCAMVNVVSEDGRWLGSIAGDRDDTYDDVEFNGNIFVDEGLGAIDGVTYAAEAEGITYEKLSSLEGVPDEFHVLKVTFLVDETPVKQLLCKYGDSISEVEIPQIPKKAGFFERWENVDLSNIRKNYKVRAEYSPWTNTIASSDDPKPEILAEAEFMPSANLEVRELSKEERNALNVKANGYVLKAYHYETKDEENETAPQTVRLHVHVKLADAAKIVTADGITDAQVQKDKEYLVFDAPASGDIVLIKTRPVRKMAVGFGVLAAAAAVLLLKKKKKKAETGEPEEEQGTEKQEETETEEK